MVFGRSVRWGWCLTIVAFGAAAAPVGNEFSDKEKKLTLTAPEAWVRQPKIESAKKEICLAIAEGVPAKGHVVPTILMLRLPERSGKPSNLDFVAESLVAKAKANHADQANTGKIKHATLGGTEGRSVEYLMETAGQLVHFKTVLAIHGEKLYVAQFYSEEADFEQQSGEGDEIVGSLHWN